MKVLILCAALLGAMLPLAYGATGQPAMTATDQKVVDAIDSLKGNLSAGIPAFGIPPLDPLTLPNISLHIDQSKLKLSLQLGDTQILDLMTFNITYLHLNLIYLTGTFDVYIPEIVTNGYYDIDGLLLYLLPVWGSGPFNVVVGDITANGSISIVIKGQYISVTSMALDLYFQTLQTDFQGLLGNDDLANQIESLLDTLIPMYWANLEPEVMAKIIPVAVDLINELLQKVTISEIMGILGLS